VNVARKKFVCGNWKMHRTAAEARALVRELRAAAEPLADRVDVAIAPPFTALFAAAAELSGSRIGLGAQNLHWESQGAFTGEVSAPMLVEAGCRYVLCGHSERRQFFGDTDEAVQKKTRAALAVGLHPVVCVGETLPERESGRTLEVVGRQVRAALSGLTPAQAQEVHAAIRAILRELAQGVADAVRILYGGSVKPDNAAELLSQPDVDGALVGGASLKAADFTGIIQGAIR
jgi:triosephosphate isomerase